jgi:hypothetical protein
MSAIEQEPLLVTGIAVAAAETLVANIAVPGVGLDTSLSAITQKTTPYKAIRVRGLIWVTATISYVSAVKLRQGNGNTTTLQVGQTLSPPVPTAGIVGFAFPFEFIDLAPIGLWYSLTAIANTADTCSAIVNITGWDG